MSFQFLLLKLLVVLSGVVCVRSIYLFGYKNNSFCLVANLLLLLNLKITFTDSFFISLVNM